MRIIYTLVLLILVPLLFLAACALLIAVEDFMQRHFGKPPIWVVAINITIWVVLFVTLAWEQAGKWIK